MAHIIFTHKGYGVYHAAVQPSKRARGGRKRSVQVIKNSCIVKQFRYDVLAVDGFATASKKACDWIDDQINLTKP